MSSPTRPTILHAIPTLTGGGAERQLALLACEQQAQGARVHVACVAGGVNLRMLNESGVAVHVLPKFGNHDPLLVLRLLLLMRRVRPAIVQTWLPQMDVVGGLAARLLGLPHILSERASPDAYGSGWKERLRRCVGVRADAVAANSATGLTYWREAGMRGCAFVVRNGVDAERIVRAKPVVLTEVGLSADSKVVLFAGRLVEEKNLPLLLDAIELVSDADPSVALVMLGEGPLNPWLVERIAGMRNAGRIRLYGYSDALPSWMKAANVLVSTSRHEGAPNVIMEAMAAGCPLVVSDIPGHRELVGEGLAVLCSALTAEVVSAGILGVLRDPGPAASRAARALEAAAGWSMSQVARAYFDMYERVLEGRCRM